MGGWTFASVFLMAATTVSGQTPAPTAQAEPQFEVASIKPNNSGSGRSSSSMPETGTYRAVNLSLQQLLMEAFRVRAFQISGAPDWWTSDRFDVQAKAPEDAEPNRMPAMLRALLRERFGLVVHTESREEAVYLLTYAREDRRLGGGLTPSTCQGNSCGINSNLANGVGTMKGTGRTMPELAAWMSNMVDGVVLDRTGNPDHFDIELSFSRDVPGTVPQPQDPPLIFTAVREQLGLRLESARAAVDVLVIDRVDHPTPD